MRPRNRTWLYDYVNEERLPFAKYHFKYRSLGERPPTSHPLFMRRFFRIRRTLTDHNRVEALKSLYIVPRSPSPVPLDERPEENMSPDELRELVRQLKVGKMVPSQCFTNDTHQ